MQWRGLTLALAAVAFTATPAAAKSIEKILASAGGTGPDDAYKVSSVEQEYRIAAALGLEVGRQSLNIDGKRQFDKLVCTDKKTGETRELWFDVTSFYLNF
jgi:hypothetical protein